MSLHHRLRRLWPFRARTDITISMVVATYNVAPYLDAFLDSLIAQDAGLDGLDVILVNDGSTDASGQIADRWAARYPRVIRVLHQDNQGVARARNAGLAQARGDWICFPDPDDLLSANFVSAIRADIASQPPGAPVAVVSNLLRLDDASQDIHNSHRLRYRFDHGPLHCDSTDPAPYLLAHTHSTVMHRATLTDHGLTFDPDIRPSFEDAVLLNRLILAAPGRQISFLPDPVYYYRQRQDASSLTGGASRDLDWYAPHLRRAYLPLLQEAKALRGHVPRFVQLIVLLSLTAKLAHMVSPRFDTDLLDAADQRDFHAALDQVMALIEADVLRDPGIATFRTLHCAALLARFKDTQLPVTHANLIPAAKAHDLPPQAAPGVWLRWRSGGATPVTLTARQGTSDIPDQHVSHDPQNLLGTPYLQRSLLWLPLAPTDATPTLHGPHGAVTLHYRGTPLAPNARLPAAAFL